MGVAPGGKSFGVTIRPILEGTTANDAREDAEVAAGYVSGDPPAVALVDRWIGSAAAPFRRRLAAEFPDVLQEVRLEVLRLLQESRWRGEARLKTYLWRVVAHTCLDALRRRQRRPVHEPADPEAPL